METVSQSNTDIIPEDVDAREVQVERGSADSLSGQSRSVNLRASYPLSYLSIYVQSWRWILGFISSMGLIRYGQWVAVDHPVFTTTSPNPLLELDVFYMATYYLFYIALAALCCKMIYEHLFHITYYYGIEAEHFVITSGVLLKQRSSLHTSLITDIFMTKNVFEWVLGLFSIKVANPSPENKIYNKISSLSTKDAIGLQDFLVNVVKETREGYMDEQPELVNGSTNRNAGRRRQSVM